MGYGDSHALDNIPLSDEKFMIQENFKWLQRQIQAAMLFNCEAFRMIKLSSSLEAIAWYVIQLELVGVIIGNFLFFVSPGMQWFVAGPWYYLFICG